MLAVNFFWFWTNNSEVWINTEMQTETVSVINVESVSKELVSSWAWDVLLFWIIWASVFFALFAKKFS